MAEKKFSGAPFGTQTARFDVTGVHPNKKIPGTFTQIPYDKPSTMELLTSSEKLNNVNDHLMIEREFDSRNPKSKQEYALNKNADQACLLKSYQFKLNRLAESILKMENDLYQFTENGAWKASLLITDKNLSNKQKFILINFIHNKEFTALMKKSMEPPLCFGIKKNIFNLMNAKKKVFNLESELFIPYMLQNKNISNNNSTSEVNLAEDSEKNVQETVSVTDQFALVNPSAEVDLVSEIASSSKSQEIRAGDKTPSLTITRASKQDTTPVKKSFSAGKKTETKKAKARQIAASIQTLLSQASVEAISNETSREKIKSLIALHTTEKRASAGSIPKPESLTGPRVQPLTSVTKASLMQLKWNKKIVECENNMKESESQSEEKDTEFEEKPSLKERLRKIQEETCDSFLRRKLGPGAYNTCIGGFSVKSVENKASGPGWARQLEVERLASLPHLLYKEQWEENKMLKRKLGPGSYDIKDFIQMANEKPRSGRGICDKLAPRFEKANLSATPGPGTYGIGGVPQRAIEDKDAQSTSTKGILDKGDRKRTLPSVGSHLGPGTYRHKTCTDELLNKVTSLKGPYRLYSGDRNKPISEGYLAAPQLADLGPGQYEIGSFVDELHSKERRTHGKFGKMAQYPEVPTDRLFLFSHAHCNRKGIPGPGAYSLQELSKPTTVNSPGFLSSAKRDDKISQKFFTRNFNPVGAGRYDVQKYDEAQDVNGHCSVFKSKTGKPNLQMSKFLQERIRAKDVSVEDRVVLCQPTKMTRSLTVM